MTNLNNNISIILYLTIKKRDWFNVEHAILVLIGVEESKRAAEEDEEEACQEGKEVAGYALVSNYLTMRSAAAMGVDR